MARLPLLLAALVAGTARAENPAPPSAAAPALSPRLSAVIADSLPKYQPPGTGQPTPAPAPDQPRNTIVRLPDYVVRDARPPDSYDLITRKGHAQIAMNRYLGPSNGFDRAFLNAVTLVDLWKSIPVLGKVPFVPFGSQSNADRALEIYDPIERKRRMQELLGREAMPRDPTPPAATPVSTSPPAADAK